jgi:hypothetical protein
MKRPLLHLKLKHSKGAILLFWFRMRQHDYLHTLHCMENSLCLYTPTGLEVLHPDWLADAPGDGGLPLIGLREILLNDTSPTSSPTEASPFSISLRALKKAERCLSSN